VEEGGERVAGADGDDDTAGTRVEGEGQGGVIGPEAVEKETEDEGTSGGGGTTRRRELARGEEDGVGAMGTEMHPHELSSRETEM
jgi:hypothetical protein